MSSTPPTDIDGNNQARVMRELTRPFLDEEVEWRMDRKVGTDAKLMCYLDLRAVQRRLDEVVGQWNWQQDYEVIAGPETTYYRGGIAVLMRKHWVWRWDGAGQRKMHGNQSSLDEGKAGVSDCLKRAASAWGMGRHLYDLGETLCPIYRQKPNGWPECRLYKLPKNGGWCIVPSIREVQVHLLTVEDLVRHLEDPHARRMARVDIVRQKMGWLPPNQVPQGQAVDILAAFEAASAVWKDDLPTTRGVARPSSASTMQLKIASRLLVDWEAEGVMLDKMNQYGEYVLSLGGTEEGTPAVQNPGPPPQGGDPWKGSPPTTGGSGGTPGGEPPSSDEIPY